MNKNLSARNVACISFPGLFLMSLCHEALVQSEALNEQEPVRKKCGVHLLSGPFSNVFVSQGIGAV